MWYSSRKVVPVRVRPWTPIITITYVIHRNASALHSYHHILRTTTLSHPISLQQNLKENRVLHAVILWHPPYDRKVQIRNTATGFHKEQPLKAGTAYPSRRCGREKSGLSRNHGTRGRPPRAGERFINKYAVEIHGELVSCRFVHILLDTTHCAQGGPKR